MISRQLESKANELLGKYPLLALTGPRQSGKTTLAQRLRPDYKYVNLELDENSDFARNDPHGFLTAHQGGVILDEVQYVPTLFPYLKHYTDQRGKTGEYILTGSQQFLLLEKIAQSLAGRVALLQLLPFSLTELQNAGLSPDSPEEYILTGGYPRIYDKNILPTDFYPAYIRTYVERDVRQIVNVTDLRLFRQFLTACAGRAGQIVNFLELGNVLGIDSKTVKSWLGILEASYIVFLLSPYHRNFDKRIVKSPKLYFFDTGLACSLLNISTTDQLNAHFAKGALFENMVITELLKQTLHSAGTPAFYFWRDSNMREIDLLMEEGAKLKAVEIKAGKTINPSFTKNLYAFQNLAGAQQVELFLVYGGDTAQPRTDLRILPWDQAAGIAMQ
ncbi:MAG: ATP-binding protein [Saprospiraceae bacterium]|jgi:predicted AAA+ superfamily ATPase|nr:ATP-binding protein [Saprospiraceae bacterium]